MPAQFATKAHPVPRRAIRGGILTVLALLMLVFTPWLSQGRAADPQAAAPATASTQGINAQQAQQVLSVMNDPQKREEFTRTLEAIAKGLPAPAPTPAPAKA
ncbi:mechanosensitive ion channel protein MscS, partial [Novacetimonas hansenii]|nr:mechanosensitive ion channel protein MscS [Novacetimonas hansenii]